MRNLTLHFSTLLFISIWPVSAAQSAIIYGPGTGDTIDLQDANGAALGTVGAGGGRLFDRFAVNGFTTLQAPVDGGDATGAFALATYTLNFNLERLFEYTLDVDLVAGASAGFATSVFQFHGPGIQHDVTLVQNQPDFQLSETGVLGPGSYTVFFSSRSEVDGQVARNNGASFDGSFAISEPQSVPEPSTWITMLVAPILILARRTVRREKAVMHAT